MDSASAPILARRSSFQASQDLLGGNSNSALADAEAAAALARAESNEPIVKSTDMTEILQQQAIKTTQDAIQLANKERGNRQSELHNVMARYIKKEFDASHGGVWHCVVGRNFGSFVVHQARTFIYFYIGHTAVLLFKSGSQAL